VNLAVLIVHRAVRELQQLVGESCRIHGRNLDPALFVFGAFNHFKHLLPLERLVELMSENPRKRFGITADPGFTVFETATEYEVNPDDFLSKGKSSPFTGTKLFGTCLLTVYGGKAVYCDKKLSI
jgi:dihydroorotase-like cyclic amidohydrolase